VLDVGSNTVHLLVVDARRGGHPTPMSSTKASLRLAEAITLINQTIQRVETNGDVLYVMCQSYSA